MRIGNKDFDLQNNIYIMGILNVTPDSFSDGGHYNVLDNALVHCERMIKEGMSIVDIGGESTRPGFTKISIEEEIERVCPVIEAVKERFDIPISLDTYKPEVAGAGIKAGADMINDIYGLKYSNEMSKIIADTKTAICLMHNRVDGNKIYKNLVNDVYKELEDSINIALEAGVKEDKIIIDPGIGFAKSYEDNLIIMNNLEKLKNLNKPILLGTSRKSMIGLTLGLDVDDRLEGTIATTVLGIQKGCSIIRVHDVKENYRAAMMTKAILHSEYDFARKKGEVLT